MHFLPDIHLPRFLDLLSAYGELHGPVLTDDGVMAFSPIRSLNDIQINYSRTLLPPKKYLLPPRETILTWSPEVGYLPTMQGGRPLVLFGLHPCDLEGIAYLDRIFLAEPPDPFYAVKRGELLLVGVSCEPDQFCFCGSTNGKTLAGADLYLEACHGGFYLDGRGKKCEALLASIAPFLEERGVHSRDSTRFPGEAPVREAAAAGEKFAESPLWEEFAASCLSCGACSLCCPTCYCFDIRENGDKDGVSASRLREWDNCLFRSHGEIAGGTNFRSSRRERFRYRYQHKYLGFGPSRGILSCVGCGRCREVCPVGIDLLRLFEGWVSPGKKAPLPQEDT